MRTRKACFLIGFAALAASLSGCGSPPAGFTMTALPSAVVVANSGPAQALTIGANAVNGFQGAVTVTLNGLPAGVTASPASVIVTPGTLQQILLTSQDAAVATTPNVQIVGTSGTLSQVLNASVQVTTAQTSASLSASGFDFGRHLAGNSTTRNVVTVTNTGGAPLSLAPSVAGDASFALAPAAVDKDCGSSLAAGASCGISVTFTPVASTAASAKASLNLGFGNVSSSTPATLQLTGASATIPAGTVSGTANPQVAKYSITLPYAGSVKVSFGTTTDYGKNTWTRTFSAGTANVLVAGMLPLTTYHMRATVTLPNGETANDIDQVFTTKDSLLHPQLTVTQAPGSTPQSGIELLTMLNGNTDGLVATDLSGNVVWTYQVPNPVVGNHIEGAKLLANGHFLITVGQSSYYPLGNPALPTGAIDSIQEIDLAGNLIRQITTVDLSAELMRSGYNLQLQEFTHEVSQLPNGHWLVLANVLKSFQDLQGYPGTTNVLGDVVIDLDTNLQPAWVWNSFDHFDVNRHPYEFPDWTHANRVVYSPSDGNLIISLRHQNWVIKVDYANGTGTGNTLWRLGREGDFALVNGTDPTDWPYAQHFPSYFSKNTSGVFTLGLLDNGDDREFPSGTVCDSTGAPPCLYSTIPIFQLDESAKTATLLFHQILPTNLYSYFGGNMGLLANGNIEVDLAGAGPSNGSTIFEETYTATPQTVWQMTVTGSQVYRGFRMPSLYPGVQW